MEKAKKTILITGPGGMLGADLVKHLKKGYKVVPLTHQDCDIRDSKKVLSLFKRYRPWIAIHSASWTDVDGCEKDAKLAYSVNAQGTAVMAKAAKLTGSILIYISSDYVFSGRQKAPYSEKDRAYPVNVYGRSKLEGEKSVRKLLKKHIIIRTSWLFGRGRRNFIDNVLSWAKEKKEMRIISDKYACPTYTLDLAKAIGRLIRFIQKNPKTKKLYGTYNLVNSGYCSWLEYARFILKTAGLNAAKMTPIAMAQAGFRASRPAFSALDNSKLSRLTGHSMRPWKKAVEEYIKCASN
ncbi:MAG TPA: dTDP-4-dehydrorhamnose reductase [Candidatus Omnitrophota bacterium]|nr:dTDP-4-dehydrorhamnose reductase [Candidatus Omnitrophota bacterium]